MSAQLQKQLGKTGVIKIQAPVPGEVTTVNNRLIAEANFLVNHLSFSHFMELVTIDHQPKRAFYELECANCNWSVRELRRQIAG